MVGKVDQSSLSQIFNVYSDLKDPYFGLNNNATTDPYPYLIKLQNPTQALLKKVYKLGRTNANIINVVAYILPENIDTGGSQLTPYIYGTPIQKYFIFEGDPVGDDGSPIIEKWSQNNYFDNSIDLNTPFSDNSFQDSLNNLAKYGGYKNQGYSNGKTWTFNKCGEITKIYPSGTWVRLTTISENDQNFTELQRIRYYGLPVVEGEC
jgi:hypothetical protein